MSLTIPNNLLTNQQEGQTIFGNIQKGLFDRLLTNPTLAIGTSKAKVQTDASAYFVKNGALYLKAATDPLWTLSGTITNATFNVYVLTLDTGGTAAVYMGTEGATLAAVVWPEITATDEVVIGFVIVNPTGTGNFVGGTTELDDGTVTPNAVYVPATSLPSPNYHALNYTP